MKIELVEIPIRDLIVGYRDDAEEGVYAYGGKLNIRPKYQREFIYNEKQRNAVIDTVKKGFPLNSMYWVKNIDENGDVVFEVLDGQQRTISICQYVNKEFSVDFQYFFNLTEDEQEEFLKYPLMVYQCEGTDKERLEWFKTINIAGAELTPQELRNAVYTGAWLTDAKRYFSKTGCPAADIGGKYLRGSSIRQEYLETVLSWISATEGIQIEEYMAQHQNDKNATPLWLYFSTVMEWVKANFKNYRNEMKGINWGALYEAHKNDSLDADELEKKISDLMMDDDVTKKAGIYEYVLSGNERALSIRAFTASQKRTLYEQQHGVCAICEKSFEYGDMDGDHIVPWSRGGKTLIENGQMLCKTCNLKKQAGY